MEVVTIEKRTFLYICERFTEFAKRIESLCNTHTQEVENWLDIQECSFFNGNYLHTFTFKWFIKRVDSISPANERRIKSRFLNCLRMA